MKTNNSIKNLKDPVELNSALVSMGYEIQQEIRPTTLFEKVTTLFRDDYAIIVAAPEETEEGPKGLVIYDMSKGIFRKNAKVRNVLYIDDLTLESDELDADMGIQETQAVLVDRFKRDNSPYVRNSMMGAITLAMLIPSIAIGIDAEAYSQMTGDTVRQAYNFAIAIVPMAIASGALYGTVGSEVAKGAAKGIHDFVVNTRAKISDRFKRPSEQIKLYEQDKTDSLS